MNYSETPTEVQRWRGEPQSSENYVESSGPPRRLGAVQSPDAAVEQLVARVHGRVAGRSDPEAIRFAFASVLSELEVRPGDPAWTDGRDVIGAAYERVLHGRERRALGQFFTPLSIGRAIAAWLLAEEPRMLLDPACGSGSLLAAAAQERTGRTRFVGVDVDPLAIAMASANATLRRVSDLELHTRNFLTEDVGEQPDAVVCNPPFTRHHALTRDAKRAIHEGFSRRLGLDISQLASLHVLFLVRAIEVSTDDARLAFITPAHWLDRNYGRVVKLFLLERAHVEAIVQFPANELVFEGALTTAAVTFIRKGGNLRGSRRTRFVRAGSIKCDEILRALRSDADVSHVRLSAFGKWSRVQRRPGRRVTNLEEVARVRRGAATGCNEFFVLSDEDRRLHGLNWCSLRPCAASPRWFDGDEIADETLAALPASAPRWLLYPSRARLGGPLERYLQREALLGVRERHLVKQRVKAGRPWWEVEADFAAPILFTYLNRSRPRFVRNRAGAIPLNNWLVIDPLSGVDPDTLFAALKEASKAVLQVHAREYGNGLWKLEPSELKRLPLPGRWR
jgi:adenine-specific DNA-methyltransferase